MDYREIIRQIEAIAPVETAEPWDRVGLMIEPVETDITGVLFALDATPDVAQEAKDLGCEMVVTHHPLFFKPLFALTSDSFEGRTALAFARLGIGLYCAHTNLDASPMGTWAALLEALELPEGSPLPGFACGAVTEAELTPQALVNRIREKLCPQRLTSIGPVPERITRIAVATGAGADAIPAAKAAGAKVLVSRELKYHEALPAAYDSLWILAAGHYETEYAHPYQKRSQRKA